MLPERKWTSSWSKDFLIKDMVCLAISSVHLWNFLETSFFHLQREMVSLLSLWFPCLELDGQIDRQMSPHNVKWLGREWASLSHPRLEAMPIFSSLFSALFLLGVVFLSPKLSEVLRGRWISSSSLGCTGVPPSATSHLPPSISPPLPSVVCAIPFSIPSKIW